MAPLQRRRRIRSDALGAAEQVDRQIVRRGTGRKPLDQLDARDAFPQIGAAPPRRGEKPDGIAERKRRIVDDRAKARIALCVNYHLGAERYDLRGTAGWRKGKNSIDCRLGIERIEPASQDLQRRHRDWAYCERYGARSGRRRSATALGIASSGSRHSPTLKPSCRIAHFTGIGLVVAKSASMSGKSDAWSAAASSTRPAR